MMPVVAKINTVVAKVKNIDCNEKFEELELQPNVYAAFLLNKYRKKITLAANMTLVATI